MGVTRCVAVHPAPEFGLCDEPAVYDYNFTYLGVRLICTYCRRHTLYALLYSGAQAQDYTNIRITPLPEEDEP